MVTGMNEETLRRRADMRQRVKTDLARKGIGNSDLEGMDRTADIRDGDIHEWVWTVILNGERKPLEYVMRNADGAPLLCDGFIVEPWVPEN